MDQKVIDTLIENQRQMSEQLLAFVEAQTRIGEQQQLAISEMREQLTETMEAVLRLAERMGVNDEA